MHAQHQVDLVIADAGDEEGAALGRDQGAVDDVERDGESEGGRNCGANGSAATGNLKGETIMRPQLCHLPLDLLSTRCANCPMKSPNASPTG